MNPDTNMIDSNRTKNTKTKVWLEFGAAFLDLKFSKHVQFEHDKRLDCGSNTFKEAIINLANLVDKYYLDNSEEKSGACYDDIKTTFSQYINKNNRNLLLTKTEIYDKYDKHLITRSSIIELNTGKIISNDLEYNYN